MGDGIGEGCLIHIREWVGETGGGFCFIVSCLFVLLSFGVSCPVSFEFSRAGESLFVCLLFVFFLSGPFLGVTWT